MRTTHTWKQRNNSNTCILFQGRAGWSSQCYISCHLTLIASVCLWLWSTPSADRSSSTVRGLTAPCWPTSRLARRVSLHSILGIIESCYKGASFLWTASIYKTHLKSLITLSLIHFTNCTLSLTHWFVAFFLSSASGPWFNIKMPS